MAPLSGIGVKVGVKVRVGVGVKVAVKVGVCVGVGVFVTRGVEFGCNGLMLMADMELRAVPLAVCWDAVSPGVAIRPAIEGRHWGDTTA